MSAPFFISFWTIERDPLPAATCRGAVQPAPLRETLASCSSRDVYYLFVILGCSNGKWSAAFCILRVDVKIEGLKEVVENVGMAFESGEVQSGAAEVIFDCLQVGIEGLADVYECI